MADLGIHEVEIIKRKYLKYMGEYYRIMPEGIQIDRCINPDVFKTYQGGYHYITQQRDTLNTTVEEFLNGVAVWNVMGAKSMRDASGHEVHELEINISLDTQYTKIHLTFESGLLTEEELAEIVELKL